MGSGGDGGCGENCRSGAGGGVAGAIIVSDATLEADDEVGVSEGVESIEAGEWAGEMGGGDVGELDKARNVDVPASTVSGGNSRSS